MIKDKYLKRNNEKQVKSKQNNVHLRKVSAVIY